jgi:hypothetical protein
MLGAECPLGPAKSGFELDTQEISDFSIDAVAYAALQLAFRIADLKGCLERYWRIYLNTGAREGDIFQIRYGPAHFPVLILPSDVDEVGAEHPGFHSAVLHMFVISAQALKRISKISDRITLREGKKTLLRNGTTD